MIANTLKSNNTLHSVYLSGNQYRTYQAESVYKRNREQYWI